jgi:hypothetical protein
MVVFFCNSSFNNRFTLKRLRHFPYRLFWVMFLCICVYPMIYVDILEVHMSRTIELVYFASKRYFKSTWRCFRIPWTVSWIILFLAVTIHNFIVLLPSVANTCCGP